MPDEVNFSVDSAKPTAYQIRLKGQLDSEWSEWFDGLTITQADNDETLLTGLVRDQAALYGLLKKARNLGLPLISVNCLGPDHSDGAEITPESSTISLAQGESE